MIHTLNQKTTKFLFVLSFIFSTFAFAQEVVQSEKAGVFSFENEEIDYGTIAQNADGVRVFKFTNTGDSPIVISNAKGSCGCTVPTYSKNVILPGEKGEIQVKYDTKRVGKFTKTVTLTSNASETNKILRIKGEVLTPEAGQSPKN